VRLRDLVSSMFWLDDGQGEVVGCGCCGVPPSVRVKGVHMTGPLQIVNRELLAEVAEQFAHDPEGFSRAIWDILTLAHGQWIGCQSPVESCPACNSMFAKTMAQAVEAMAAGS